MGTVRTEDMTGKRFGRWTVLKLHSRSEKNSYWLCKYDCGTVIPERQFSIRSGGSVRCRKCSKDTHGLTHHRIFKLWQAIQYRCHNSRCREYRWYGGKGICVCDEWRNDIQVFYKWAIGAGWQEGLTIERIDPNGNYKPSNCEFISRSENSRRVWKANKAHEKIQPYKIQPA